MKLHAFTHPAFAETHRSAARTLVGLVAVGALFAFGSTGDAQVPSRAKPTPAAPAVDPAIHAAHTAAGTHPDPAPAPAGTGDPALSQQFSQLQAKVAQLEAALAKNAPPMPAPPAAMPGMAGMPPAAAPAMRMGMKPDGNMPGMSAGATPAPAMAGMGGGGMMGMMDKMMGMMDKMMGMGGAPMPSGSSGGGMGMDMDMVKKGGGGAMPAPAPAAGMSNMSGGGGMMSMMGMMDMGGGSMSAMPQSALPGFPGASHLYHLGATGFFLDHPQHIALTTEQQAGLNKAKEQALLAKSTADRAVEQAEQALWTLTAADQPDATQVEAKIREIEKLRGDERLSFIRAVGDASKLLTDEQRKSLTGFAPPASAMPMPAPGAAMPAGGMKDM